jgi:membrane dipeptidase
MKKNYTIPIIDLHTDYTLAIYEKGKQFKSEEQINLKLIREGGIKVFFTGFSYDDLFKDTEKQIDTILKNVSNKKNNLILIKKAADLSKVFGSKNKIGIILHLEGAAILDKEMKIFNRYYDLGLRSIGLTHSGKNQLAAGNKNDPQEHISSFGKKVVKEAIKRNMIVDLAHLNYAGFYDVLDLLSSQPPVVTHTCVYKYCPDPRNLKDEQIKEIAKRKGIIGIFFSAKYVKPEFKTTTINDVIKHFVHVAEIGGVDILSIGSDFGGITTGLPKNLENVSKLKILLQNLKKVGFNDQDIEKIAYLNAYRVINQILR